MNVELSGDFDALPESHRTCTCRVVREALTNCARHARARPLAAPGLGLFGIEERVRELGGHFKD